MPTSRLDRTKLLIKPLSARASKSHIADIAVSPSAPVPDLPEEVRAPLARLIAKVAQARAAGRPVMVTYGAHTIKNGLAPVLIRLLQDGWVTHLATNGAGSIHDWEFAYLGRSEEDVRVNAARGEFGTWEETGRYINLAVTVGAAEGLGYGASVGKLVAEEGVEIPSVGSLRQRLTAGTEGDSLGAVADLLSVVTRFGLPAGWMAVPHPHKQYSIQAAAYRAGAPVTVHPGLGYDIIYTHPMNCGGAMGRAGVRDFLAYAQGVRQLSGGVHISIGSAIMAPMIFEKSLSMANNLARQEEGAPLSDYALAVVDLQESGGWDWSRGEPPKDNPAYYLRFCKTFSRMGGELSYFCLDNRAFLLALSGGLEGAAARL